MLQKQPTKAQKRRQHQAEREAEREAELEAERAEQGESEKTIEDRELKEMLAPLGLTYRFIQVWQFSLLVSCCPHCSYCFCSVLQRLLWSYMLLHKQKRQLDYIDGQVLVSV